MIKTLPVSLKKIEELIASIKEWCNETFSLSTHNHDAKYASKDHTHTNVVVESGSNTNGRYRKWSDGLIEQWGTGSSGKKVTLPISFPDTNYMVFVSPQSYGKGQSFGSKSRTVSSFVLCSGWTCDGHNVESNTGGSVFWFARSL